MLNLKDTTFIIPISIESEDREKNAMINLSYLCKHLETNITIFEVGSEPKLDRILSKIDTSKCQINYLYDNNVDQIFHRTKFLNIMLDTVKTKVVVNYDIDVLLKPEVYEKCQQHILNGQDLVYPYFFGNSQYQVYYTGRDKIESTMDLNTLDILDYNICRSEYGQCQFFNTESYKKGGMENEGFISYAPEDQERGYRFKKLDYNVMWNNDFIYHIEHTRGINSSNKNPMMDINNKLFEFIKSLTKEQLIEYYKNIEYLKKYKKYGQ